MVIANLMISVFVEPIFQVLYITMWALVFVVLVEFVVTWRLSKTNPLVTLGLVALANILSTAVGYLLIIFAIPSKWHVVTSPDQLHSWKALLIAVGYILCFIFSVVIEMSAYRVFETKLKARISLRTIASANALSYLLTPLALWLYERAIYMIRYS